MGQKLYRTLIVDSDPLVRDLAHQAMTQRNILCDRAPGGAEALQMFESQSYDAVVTDLWMPEVHGHALACNLLDRPDRPRIVVLSSVDEPRLLTDLRARGVDETYVKPIDFRFLAQRVEQLAEAGGDGHAAPLRLLQRIEESLQQWAQAGGDRLGEVLRISPEQLPDPPQAITEYVSRSAAAEAEVEYNGLSQVRRGAKRVTCVVTAVAVPVTRNFKPTGEPFKLSIRDLSQGGVRLLNSRAVTDGYLALAWDATCLAKTRLCVVVRVIRCQPIARFYDIGGQFFLD